MTQPKLNKQLPEGKKKGKKIIVANNFLCYSILVKIFYSSNLLILDILHPQPIVFVKQNKMHF